MSAPPRIASPKMLQELPEAEEDVRQTHMPSSWPSEVDENPLLGHQISVLGMFFKNHREREDRQELRIFITPRILNQQTISQCL